MLQISEVIKFIREIFGLWIEVMIEFYNWLEYRDYVFIEFLVIM